MNNTIEQRVMDTFHHLHNNAEISWKEVQTTSYIEGILKESGCTVRTFDDCTGVVGDFGNFNAGLPVVAVRADIDALWQEVNGEFQANHSCGHDAHMSMVLGLLWRLEQEKDLAEKVAVRFIFQPAEEKGSGALKMVEKNVVDDVDYLFGVHLRPVQEAEMGHATPVIVHGATRMYSGVIRGEDAHGARPHLNHNAIEIGAQIVNMLKQIHIDPLVPHSAKMTAFQAGGESTNIIPGNASFSLDIRAQTNEEMERLDTKVNNIMDALKDLYDVDIAINLIGEIAAAKLNDDAIDMVRGAIVDTLGEEGLDEPLITPGGDDFHYYTIKKPSLKATMLGIGCDLKPGLHHPNMTFDEKALQNGTDILYKAVKNVYSL
ncbi:amidohydrolase [Virgibacillus natechei]|uniref:Amidohydrolase n=1 Tax=Virgibacillus natechei TaxID=1216297 RepID=A0ABS4III9_9BACI|nr:M20 peptidase aminoacylase family protein [Virgibacillus natechei]MBP1970777.1 amidohydrolase [Virgibacillus natechei]UZD12321.1 M20 peptidase aminoacylase family protein [Virgibacillus natechei]